MPRPAEPVQIPSPKIRKIQTTRVLSYFEYSAARNLSRLGWKGGNCRAKRAAEKHAAPRNDPREVDTTTAGFRLNSHLRGKQPAAMIDPLSRVCVDFPPARIKPFKNVTLVGPVETLRM